MVRPTPVAEKRKPMLIVPSKRTSQDAMEKDSDTTSAYRTSEGSQPKKESEGGRDHRDTTQLFRRSIEIIDSNE